MAAKKKTTLSGHTAVWQTQGGAYSEGQALLDDLARVRGEMSAKWGQGRLRLLVSPELRAKFDLQREKLNRAEWWAGIDELRLQATRMSNAWRVLDKAATDAGHAPAAVDVWEIGIAGGQTLYLCKGAADAYSVPVSAPGPVWSLEEVARLIEAQADIVAEIKARFKGSTVVDIRPKKALEGFEDDDIEDIL